MSKGIIAALLAATLYGINIVFARMATNAGVPPTELVFYRVFLLLIISLLFMRSFMVPKHKIIPLALLGGTSAMVGIAYFTSVKYISVTQAAPVFYTFPLWILLFTPLVMKTKPDPLLYPLFGVAFFGLCLIIGFSFQIPDWRGIIAALLASFAATAQFFMAKRVSEGLPAANLFFYVNLASLPVALIVSLLQGGPAHPSILLNAFWSVMIVCFAFLFAFVLQMEASKAAPPAVIGLVFCFEPVVSLIVSAMLLGETLTLIQLIGAILVILSLILASIMQLRKA